MATESIEMWLDDECASIVHDLWDALAEAGLRRHIDRNLSRPKPHVTIATRLGMAGIDVDPDDAGLCSAAAACCGTEFALTSWGLFTSKRYAVLYLAPAASHELCAAHDAVMQALPPVDSSRVERELPRDWTPHCTLAKGLKKSQVADAIDVVRSLRLPIAASVDRVVHWDPAAERQTVLAER